MNDDARAQVLSAVRAALADVVRPRAEPPIVSIPETREEMPELARRFSAELAALKGTAWVVPDREACSKALADYLTLRGASSLAVQSSPLATAISLGLDGFDLSLAVDHDKQELACADAALLEGRSLLADTGSVVLVLDNASDRVLPYLPRTCAIVAAASSLHATMSPQAMSPIESAARDGLRGEVLIVAGPSRSADIEKVLVLGAHGPQSVAVFIVENE